MASARPPAHERNGRVSFVGLPRQVSLSAHRSQESTPFTLPSRPRRGRPESLSDSDEWSESSSEEEQSPRPLGRREIAARTHDGSSDANAVDEDDMAVDPPVTPRRRRNIDDCISEMEITKVNMMAVGPRPADDTVIFLLPPPKAPEQSAERYASIERRYTRPMYGRSEVFRQYAPEFYAEHFEPARQARIRRSLAGRLAKIGDAHMSYVLDLTPTLEGDDAIRAVLELECPFGILHWRFSPSRFGCHRDIVSGMDAAERDQEPQAYSQVRHHIAIERLILAMHGFNPNFDSAIKVYTTSVLAKHFRVVGDRLQDWAVTWIRSSDNTPFIEVLPEATLTMAESLQSPSLAVDAFALLLGERLLEKDQTVEGAPAVTFHGRRRYEIAEEWQTRLQYAMHSMESRIEAHFEYLAGPEMRWVEQLDSYQSLSQAHSACERCGCLADLQQYLAGLKRFLRGCIFQCLAKSIKAMPPVGYDTGGGGDGGEKLHPTVDYKISWALLPLAKRKYTRIFWHLLQSIKISNLWYATCSPMGIGFTRDFHMENDKSSRINATLRLGVTPYVTMGSLDPSLDRVRDALIALPVTSLGNPIPAHMEQRGMRAFGVPGRLTVRNEGISSTSENPQLFDSMESVLSFDLSAFLAEAESRLHQMAGAMLRMPLNGGFETSEVRLSNVLLCLDEEELRYLPLWAGGLDDGTGGVFNNDVPLAAEGFSTHGPSIRQGTDSREPSEYSWVDARSDAPTSAIVHDGYSDTLDRRRVYANSDVSAENDHLWTDVLAHRDRQMDAVDRADEVASVGSEATETALPRHDGADEEGSGAESTEAQEKMAAKFTDYSDIFMDSDEENAMDEHDDEGERHDSDSDLDIIDADEGLEAPEIVVPPATAMTSAASSAPAHFKGEGKVAHDAPPAYDAAQGGTYRTTVAPPPKRDLKGKGKAVDDEPPTYDAVEGATYLAYKRNWDQELMDRP